MQGNRLGKQRGALCIAVLSLVVAAGGVFVYSRIRHRSDARERRALVLSHVPEKWRVHVHQSVIVDEADFNPVNPFWILGYFEVDPIEPGEVASAGAFKPWAGGDAFDRASWPCDNRKLPADAQRVGSVDVFVTSDAVLESRKGRIWVCLTLPDPSGTVEP